MSIIDFTAPEKVNPYTDDVKTLADAGEGKGFEIIKPTAESNKARMQFAKAANAINKSARLRVKEDNDTDGTTRMVFTLSNRHKARRGDATDAESVKDELNADSALYADTDSMHAEPTEPAAKATPVKGKPVK